MTKVKWWICGSRTAKSYTAVEDTLNEYLTKEEAIIRTGGAIGVDRLAERWAHNNQIEMESSITPNWHKYGKGAGFMRNKEGIDWADKVFAIWDGKSRGTEHCINYARSTGKTIVVVRFK